MRPFLFRFENVTYIKGRFIVEIEYVAVGNGRLRNLLVMPLCWPELRPLSRVGIDFVLFVFAHGAGSVD